MGGCVCGSAGAFCGQVVLSTTALQQGRLLAVQLVCIAAGFAYTCRAATAALRGSCNLCLYTYLHRLRVFWVLLYAEALSVCQHKPPWLE